MIWYPLHVRSQREGKVGNDLRAEGQIVFVPLRRVIRWRRNSRGGLTKMEIDVLEAPGYVFASEPWGIVSKTGGRRERHADVIGSFVKADGKPASISEAQMARFMKELASEVIDETAFKALKQGDIVKMSGGFFTDKSGVVVEDKGQSVAVEIEMLGAKRVIDVQRGAIAA